MARTSIRLLRWSDRCQGREAMNIDHVASLREAYLSNPASVPPLDVVERDDGSLLVVDGYHRLHALQGIQSDDERAEVLEDISIRIVARADDDRAAWLALGMNADHRGLPRSRNDKRRVVRLALEHPYAGDLTQRDLAEACRVSVDLVATVRAELTGAPSPQTAAKAAADEAVAANPDAPDSELAKKVGVNRSTIHRAKSRNKDCAHTGKPNLQQNSAMNSREPVADTGKPPEGHPGPPGAVEAYRAIADLLRAARRGMTEPFKAISEADRAAITKALETARWLADGGEPVACEGHEGEGCKWCNGRGWVRASDSKRWAKSRG